MITLKNKQEIILLSFRAGKSQRAIERETGINRKTISKYIKDYEAKKQQLLAADCDGKDDILELIDNIVEPPIYNGKNRTKTKVTKKLLTAIEFHLTENEKKASIGQRKQQKKKVDIHEALVSAGFDVSYSTVCNTVRALTNQGAEAFIRAQYDLGDVCEFDWGDVRIFINGQLRKLQMAAFTGASGNYRQATLFAKQDTSCFLESHALFFDHLQGVYRTMVYDNMKVAVKKFVGTEKEPTDALLRLSLYYGFQFRFCNVRAGWEKGHVERSVEYIRRKAFSHKDSFSSIEEANEYLNQVCLALNSKGQKGKDGQTALDILEQERAYLFPRLPMYDAAKTTELRVNKYSVITVDNCYYSVPDQYVGKLVFTKIYSDRIRCFYDGTSIAEHNRQLGVNVWTITLEHYLSTLKKKPGALASSVGLHQANPRLQQIYHRYYTTKERDFIDLIHFISEKGLDKVEEAIGILTKVNPLEVTTETIKAICNRTTVVQPVSITRASGASEIQDNSLAMLKMFKQLMPSSGESFEKEVAII